MILPTKHISANEALLGVGGTMLAQLTVPMTISNLWDRVRTVPNVGTYERFVLATNLLYMIGAVDIRDGLIVRTAP